MKKKKVKSFLITSCLLINALNVLFTVYKVKGGGYGRKALQIIVDYFVGFHSILLLFIICIILTLFLLKKISELKFLHYLFLALLLFFITINLVNFPKMYKSSWNEITKYLTRKANNSLEEMLSHSSATNANVIKNYMRMNGLISQKTLFIPTSTYLEKDLFFQLFITSKNISRRTYNYRLSKKSFEYLKIFPSATFEAYKNKEINQYIIIKAPSDSNEFILYLYAKNYVFVPPGLIRLFPFVIND